MYPSHSAFVAVSVRYPQRCSRTARLPTVIRLCKHNKATKSVCQSPSEYLLFVNVAVRLYNPAATILMICALPEFVSAR
jgi:hypothetical protein